MKKLLTYILLIATLVSCSNNSVPKPYGYFRVDMPQHEYRKMDTLGLPYKFDMALSANVTSHENKSENFWIDLNYPYLNASIYCSYKPIHGNLIELLEDTRHIVYKHSIKADGITEKVFESPERHVYGILYDLKGNTASSVQFVLTDSVRHFFRGALYFNNVPNKDSIAPMSRYIREDIIRMMESFEWRK